MEPYDINRFATNVKMETKTVIEWVDINIRVPGGRVNEFVDLLGDGINFVNDHTYDDPGLNAIAELASLVKEGIINEEKRMEAMKK